MVKIKKTVFNNLVLFTSILHLSLSAIGKASPNTCQEPISKTKGLSESLELAKNFSPTTRTLINRYSGIPNRENKICDKNYLPLEQATIKTFQDLYKTTENYAEPIFNTECLKIIAQPNPGVKDLVQCSPNQNQFDLFTNTQTSRIKYDNNSRCLTDSIINYQNMVLSDALRCLKNNTDFPLSPENVLKKIAQESTFKPNVANGNGTGLGQVTGIYLEDLFAKHRGRPYLEKIQNSKDPACDFSKPILADDLKMNRAPSTSKKCDYIQYGKGFERNVLYSLMGHITNWKSFVEPRLKPILKKLKNSSPENIQKIKEYLTLIAYGRNGYRNVNAIVNILNTYNTTSAVDILKLLTNERNKQSSDDLNDYLVELNTREKTVVSEFDTTKPQHQLFKEKGYKSCVNN